MLIGLPEWTMEEVGVANEDKPVAAASRHTISLSGSTYKYREGPPPSSNYEVTSPCCSPVCPEVWLHGPGSQASSALQSKVKALREREAAQKRRSNKNLHQKPMHGSHTQGSALTGSRGSRSSAEDTEPGVQVFTFRSPERDPHLMPADEGDLHLVTVADLLALPRAFGESLEKVEADDTAKQDSSSTCKKPWVSPEDVWGLARPEVQLLNGHVTQGWAGPVSGPSKWEELDKCDGLGNRLRGHACSESNPGPSTGSRLAPSPSLESVSSRSTSSLSLAERVEMNRGVLRQMLQKAHHNPLTNQKVENPPAKGGPNDSAWNSGISLHDGEHQRPRAFVSADELLPSPRRQQAKQLLERARMKGRSHPLKADHTILPVQRDNPVPLTRVRALVAGRSGVVAGPSSGNLSDSSSSDSTCSSRRRPGHSPTRVRFHDESDKDAEVRYQERQHQHHQAAERAQGPLGSKPSLAAYINTRAVTGQAGEAEHAPECHSGRSHEASLNSNGYYGPGNVGRQCESCGTILDKGLLLPSSTPFPTTSPNEEVEGELVPCWLGPTLPNRVVRIEQIRETYIGLQDGLIMDSEGTQCRAAVTGDATTSSGTLGRQRRRSRRVDRGPEPVALTHDRSGRPRSPRTGRGGTSRAETGLLNTTTALPPNPYSPQIAGKSLLISKAHVISTVSPGGDSLSFQQPQPPQPQPIPPPLQCRKSALKHVALERPSGQRGSGRTPPLSHLPLHREPPQAGGDVELRPQDNRREESKALDNLCLPGPQCSSTGPAQKSSAGSKQSEDVAVCPGQPGSKPTGLEQEHISRETRASPTETLPAQPNGMDQVPTGPEQDMEDSTNPSLTTVSAAGQRDVRPRLSLRRLFSAMGLSASPSPLRRGRSCSMEQLGPRPESPAVSPVRPSPAQTQPGLLRKTPSLQSLRLGSPFLQLKKSSSVQNIQSPKRKMDRSSAYTPGDEPCSPASSRGLVASLSVEDVGSPSALRSVGRVARAFPDGTLLLELSRPPSGTFGFLISRGKGRPDSGVYVEEMGDCGTQKLYTGLLGVGDEIVEVNGEKVAGLGLDAVTELMTQSSTASVRVLRHRTPTANR